MTSRELTAVAAKCVGIYLFFSAFVTIPFSVYWVGDLVGIRDYSGYMWMIISTLLVSGAFFFLGFMAWRFSLNIVKKVNSAPVDEIKSEIKAKDLEAILFRVLGVYFFVCNIKPFVMNIYRYQKWNSLGQEYQFPVMEEFVIFAVLAFSMFLIAKPNEWVRMIKNIRDESYRLQGTMVVKTCDDNKQDNDNSTD